MLIQQYKHLKNYKERDKTMENQDNELMAELENIIAIESKRIAEPTDAQSEGLAIFKNLITAMEQDNPLVGTQVYSIRAVEPDEAKQALAEGAGRLVSNGFSKEENETASHAGRVELIADSVPVSKIRQFLGDLETALVLSQWKEPQGLLARAKRKGELVQAMALGNILIFQKVLASGDTITKSWDTNEEIAPEPDEFDNKWDFEFLKNTYTHLTLPNMLKAQSPIMYEHILDMLKKNIAKQVLNGERPPDLEGDLGDGSSDDD